ncbi:MAG: cytochrome c [Alphaproteobacteria bacterium]|nr:cytochrome c [Alphaproteobacteria bacterium]
MSRFPRLALIISVLVLGSAAHGDSASAEPAIALGRAALPEEIAAWDIDVRPDGVGLPSGKGSVKQGEELFLQQCAACHGEFGEGAGRWPAVAGGRGSLTDDNPGKAIGAYWPYVSTIFDYVRRSMPFGNAQSLTSDEVYAVTAFLLFINDVVGDDFVLSPETFTSVRLPNANGFYEDDREITERALWNREPCMINCKSEVMILNRARVLDVTPEDAKGAGSVD